MITPKTNILLSIINLNFPFDESFNQHKLADYSRKAIAKFYQQFCEPLTNTDIDWCVHWLFDNIL